MYTKERLVGSVSGAKETFMSAGVYGGIFGGMGGATGIERLRTSPPRSSSTAVSVQTVSLTSVLEEVKAPKFIDYLSLDVDSTRADSTRRARLRSRRWARSGRGRRRSGRLLVAGTPRAHCCRAWCSCLRGIRRAGQGSGFAEKKGEEKSRKRAGGRNLLGTLYLRPIYCCT